jgi:hypothetical protein
MVSIMPGMETGAPLRNEQGRGGVAELLAARIFESGEVCLDLGFQFRGHPAVPQIRHAGVTRDREARGHRYAEVGHLGEVGALAAEDVLHVPGALGGAVAEEVDGGCHLVTVWRIAPGPKAILPQRSQRKAKTTPLESHYSCARFN